MRSIALTKGKEALVDDSDYEWLSQYSWYTTSHGYVARRERSANRKLVYMHRLILGPPTGMEVDHIDGNRLNNCRDNLRIATRRQQLGNTRLNPGESGYRGVSKNGNSWVAAMYRNNKKVHLGCFSTREDAARAYDNAASEWFGEFATLNGV